MSVKFECEKEFFVPLATHIYSYAQNKGISLNGYQEDVCQQMEVIYTILKKEAHKSEEEPDMNEIIKNLLTEDCLFKLSLQTGGVFNIAGYLCSFLLEYGLKPVFIFSQQQLAVGVWLYEDYDMETAFIESVDFLEEAYDMGGCMLAVSCESLLEQCSFAEAVKYGCQIIRNFVCAYDIAKGNQMLDEPTVFFQNNELAFTFENGGNCQYFKQLLELYNQFVHTDEKVISIMSKEVQNGRLASYFFIKGAGQIPLPKECLDKQIIHLPEMDDEMLRKIFVMRQAQLVLAKTTHEEQARIVSELLLQNLQNSIKTVLVLGTKEQLFEIIEIFRGLGLDDYILSEWEMNTYDALNEKIRQYLSKKPKHLDMKKVEIRKKRYHDVLKALEKYETDLDKDIVTGMTLRQMFNRWAYLKKCPYKVHLQDESWKQIQSLCLVHDYTDAMEQCQQKDSKGNIYVDFTVYSSEKITKLISLLNECEKQYKLLWNILPEFKEKIGDIHISKEFEKQYMDCLSDCADIFVNCKNLRICKQKPQLAFDDELTAQEKEEYNAYCNFKEKRAAAQILSEYWDIKRIYLNDDEKKDLCKYCSIAIEEMKTLAALVTNRVYNKAVENIEDLLSSATITDGKVLQKLNKKRKHRLLENIKIYFMQKNIHYNYIYQSMEELFGSEDIKTGMEFIYQKMITESLQHIQKNVSTDVFDIIMQYVQAYTNKNNIISDQKIEALEQIAIKVSNYADKYSNAVKNVFRHLNIEYHEFGKEHADESMIHYIRNWQELLEKKGIYQKWETAKKKFKSQMNPVYTQLLNLEQKPRILCEAFEKAWYSNYMEKYQDKIQNYEMNLNSANKLSEQIFQYRLVEFYNELYNTIIQRTNCYQEQKSLLQIQGLQGLDNISDVLLHMGNFLQACFPVLFITLETALDWLSNTKISFDQILLCGSQSVPYYKLLYLSTKADTLLMISEGNAERDSVAERAQKMEFPQISIYRR